MYNFVVCRFTNRQDATFGSFAHQFENEEEALKDYFRECGKAVDSTHLTDSVSLLTKEGFELRHETFIHEPAPKPEPAPEEE